ncbi:flagellar FliL protein [Alteribacillus persepolensis]|uniref:Flagellar protein FliL n=1 Tax=Alteribacillus persepolensis TaxID=568899 RepID=A0A1G7YP51_9BACI|nr:flagellar basal body-associated protein FliL [Alteribacillus persepolensis]SDG98106.1 flagellar FliL protein [Alteribacillus persepolensis]
MFQNKMMNTMFVIILTMTLVGVVVWMLLHHFSTSEAGAEPTIDEIIENSWQTEEITTNLADNHYLRAQFQIHADSKKAREELEKRDFQVNNIIIHQLANMSSSDIDSEEGIQELETTVRSQINETMQTGDVIRVYTTKRIIQ